MAKEEPKITSEKPVKFPVNFHESIAALLKTKPEKKRKATKKKPPKPAK